MLSKLPKFKQLLLFFTLSSVSSLSFAAEVQHVNALPNQGGFTLDDGRLVIFHGVNEMNKTPPYTPSAIGFDTTQAQFIHDHGFNLVRLGIFWGAIEPTMPQAPAFTPVYNDAYLADIQNTVKMLASYGIYTFIDFHQDGYSNAHGGVGLGEPAWTAGNATGFNIGFPVNLFGGIHLAGQKLPMFLDQDYDRFWANSRLPDNRGIQEAYTDMVSHTVGYLKGTPGLIGYEIMNEPFPGSTWKSGADPFIDIPLSFSKGYAKFEQNSLAPFYQTITSQINTDDPSAIVFYEPVVFADLNAPINLPAISGNNLAFSYHNYNYKTVNTPFDNANNYVSKVANNIPQIMTEFGASDTDDLVNNMLAQSDSQNLSWTYWAYTNNPIYPFYNFPNKLPVDQRNQGLIYDMTKPFTAGDNVETARVALLTRPYPQIVAGTQVRYSYDLSSGIFTLSYISNAAQGKNAQTQIFVPSAIYSPYRLTVQGAKVKTTAASDDSQIVTIQNQLPNQQVTVVISPAV